MVSPIGLGTDNFGDATSATVAEKIINRALDKGINLLDTGDVYCEGESERLIIFSATVADVASPKLSIPRPIGETMTPVRPRLLYSIKVFLF
jgi:predicted oxidoreductase